MEDIVNTDEQICQELLELAQTEEQVRYLTMNNQSVLKAKVVSLQELVKEQDRNYASRTRELLAKQEGYKELAVDIIKELTKDDDY